MGLSLAVCLFVGFVALSRAHRADRIGHYERIGSQRSQAETAMTTFTDYFGPVVVDRHNERHSLKDVLSGKYLAIYIGASWDKSGSSFERTLIELHADINGRTPEPSFEVVYISADRTEEEFTRAMSMMPFVAIPFEDLVRRKRLMTIFKADLLPRFLLLSPSGERLTDDDEWVRRDPYGASFPWRGASAAASSGPEKACVIA